MTEPQIEICENRDSIMGVEMRRTSEMARKRLTLRQMSRRNLFHPLHFFSVFSFLFQEVPLNISVHLKYVFFNRLTHTTQYGVSIGTVSVWLKRIGLWSHILQQVHQLPAPPVWFYCSDMKQWLLLNTVKKAHEMT